MSAAMDMITFAERMKPKERQEFVAAAGTNTAYFSQIVCGHRKAGHDLARAMVEACVVVFPDDQDMRLELSDIRPDIWRPDDVSAAVG